MASSVDQLLMLTDQEIDYKSLSDEILEQLTLENDPYIALGSLTELWNRNSPVGVETAWELLLRTPSEYFLQSTALRICFTSDRQKTLDYMLAHAYEAHPQLLNTIVELLLYESDFRDEMRLAAMVKQRMTGHEEEMDDFLDPNTVADFAEIMRLGQISAG